MDLLLWPNAYPEIKPTLFKIVYNGGVQRPAIFDIYLNPYFQGLGEGKIEPRVYYGSNVSKVVVKRLIIFKEDNCCKYSLFLVRRAKDMLDLAREKYNGQVYDFCVHFSRFCTELSIKSIFSIFKKRFPHEHDVGRRFPYEIRTGIQKASPQVATMLPRLLWISQQLIGPERFDLYGDPDSLTPPDLIVTIDEAKTALENAELCYRQCCVLFEKVMSL